MIRSILSGVIALVGCSAPVHYQSTGSLYDFTVSDIDGKDVKLSDFKGKVLMIVNVASKCGNTPQYKPLEALYEKYKDKGLVILGFPANQFMSQEPGTNAQIKEFCSSTYHVAFPMFSKIVVKGEGIHPLYQWLIANSDKPTEAIHWNFEKFLISREGKVIKRIDPATFPDTPENIEAIEKALDSK